MLLCSMLGRRRHKYRTIKVLSNSGQAHDEARVYHSGCKGAGNRGSSAHHPDMLTILQCGTGMNVGMINCHEAAVGSIVPIFLPFFLYGRLQCTTTQRMTYILVCLFVAHVNLVLKCHGVLVHVYNIYVNLLLSCHLCEGLPGCHSFVYC